MDAILPFQGRDLLSQVRDLLIILGARGLEGVRVHDAAAVDKGARVDGRVGTSCNQQALKALLGYRGPVGSCTIPLQRAVTRQRALHSSSVMGPNVTS